MEFCSTRNSRLRVSASQAIAQGLSSEGGLFVPCEFPRVDARELCSLEYPVLARRVLAAFLTDYDPDQLEQFARQVYGENFGGKAGYLAPVREGLYALELWHGPTCAFKDYALQLMPRLLVQAKKNLGRSETTLILVATSGDTGKAALEGYRDVPGVKIAVFYPDHGTSEIQRLQMATQQGDNVAVYAINGNFDDAQTGVKRVFSDADLAQKLEQKNVRLSSANSINWGRLVPQIVYYFAAYGQLLRAGAITYGDPVDFCVPTGNFGDILAGYYAKQMGLPVGRLICASNRNRVLTDFLTTGVYNARREFYRTSSPSMDILVSSNLERLPGRDPAGLFGRMGGRCAGGGGDPRPVREGQLPLRHPHGGGVQGRAGAEKRSPDGGAVYRQPVQVPAGCSGRAGGEGAGWRFCRHGSADRPHGPCRTAPAGGSAGYARAVPGCDRTGPDWQNRLGDGITRPGLAAAAKKPAAKRGSRLFCPYIGNQAWVKVSQAGSSGPMVQLPVHFLT